MPEFVGYWTNNGQRAAGGANGSAAIDPYAASRKEATLGVYFVLISEILDWSASALNGLSMKQMGANLAFKILY